MRTTVILALHENKRNAAQVTKSLRRSGLEVLESNSYAKAIEMLQAKPVDLILSDVHLENGGSVFDFLRWVKKTPATKDIPFVLFSSEPTSLAKFFEDGVRTSARMLGASMYITMEVFDSEEFRKQIDSLLPMEHQQTKVRIP